MKIFRFHGPNAGPYTYIKCRWWEIKAIQNRIDSGKTSGYRVTWEPGPKSYGAQFVIRAKNRPCGKINRACK